MKKKPSKKATPFIKWVGGKRGLLSQIIPLFPKNFNNYFEPFVGGGAMFFELYSLGVLKDKKVYLSDINSELVNAYTVVRDTPDQLISSLEEMQKNHSKEHFYEVRNMDREKDFELISQVERAARFVYLNKTCYNGLYRVNSKGENNVPMGNYKNPNICDVEAMQNASDALQSVTIKNASYLEVASLATAGDLVYLDPPYYPLTDTANFTSYNENQFLADQQVELAQFFEDLSDLGCYAMQSNSDTKFIRNLYQNYKIKEITANRFINSKATSRGKITEVLISAKPL